MERIYCQIEAGIVIGRAVFDAPMPADWPERTSWVHNDVAQIGWLMVNGALVPPPPAPDLPPGPYRLFKSIFVERMTPEEATILEAVLLGEEAKLRLMYHSVEYFVSDDPLFAVMHWAMVQALGSEQRADELLAPA